MGRSTSDVTGIHAKIQRYSEQFHKDKNTEALITTLLNKSKSLQEDQQKEAEQKRSKMIEEARCMQLNLSLSSPSNVSFDSA